MTRGARVDATVATRAPAPITVLVVDDEAIAREGLEGILASMPGISVLPGCRNGHDAIDASRQSHPDVIFLDIEMPGIDGFGVARMLAPDPGPIVVFVTAYSSYAVGAFELEASDYLVKPFTDARVSACVARVRRL
ncbi:MAG: response regulator, partial [Gemmatimonadaceae bacterium]